MRRAFQWDLARQIETPRVLADLLARYADWGYHEVYLHLEDCVDYPSLPGVARQPSFHWKELTDLVEAAQRHGLGVVPIVNLLGHTQYLIKTERWRDLNERRAADGSPLPTGQLCPLHPETPEVIDRLFRDTLPLCTAGKIHVGLDESFHLGQCPRCRAEVAEKGLGAHFAAHARRLHARLPQEGIQMALWADMLALFPEAVAQLPPGVAAYDWYYYPFDQHPRIELHSFRDYDLTPALAAAGIEWWGCPMNSGFRFESLPVFGDRLANIRSWWRRCRTQGAAGMLITSWEAYRMPLRAATLVDAAAASLWLDRDGEDASYEELLARGLQRLQGAPKATALRGARSLLAQDAYSYTGYYEWEPGNRWDGGVTAAPMAELQRTLEALPSDGGDAPDDLGAAARLRRYFAERALFLREAVDTVAQLRQASRATRPWLRQSPVLLIALENAAELAEALQQAFADADALWNATRLPTWPQQNRKLLEADAARLSDWIAWLEAVATNPQHAQESCPVFARWRLQFEVHVNQPAVQRVSVEARGEDGSWRELAGRHIIEFKAAAAAPQTSLRRPFAVGIDSLDTPLRVVLSGPGRVRLRRFFWTDGVTALPIDGEDDFELGRPAPAHGLPDLFSPVESRELRPAK